MGIDAANAGGARTVDGGACRGASGSGCCPPASWPAGRRDRTDAERARGIGRSRGPHHHPRGAGEGRRVGSESPATCRKPLPRPSTDSRGCASRCGFRLALPLGYHEITVKVGDRSASTRYIVTPDRAWAPPHFESWRTRRRGRHQPLRRALRAQLGLRRLYAISTPSSTGRRRPGRQLHRAQSAARHPQPPAVQHQPLSAELHLLPELSVSRRRGDRGLRAKPAGAEPAEIARRCSPRFRQLRDAPVRGVRAGGGAQAAFSEAGVSSSSCGSGAGTRRAPANSGPSSSARATCSNGSPPIARSTSSCTAPTRICGSGRSGRHALPGSRIRRDPRLPAKALAHGDVSPVPCSGRSISSWAGRRSGRGNAAGDRALPRPGAGHRSLRLGPVGAPAVLTSPDAAWARRPTISRPRGRTGASLRPIPSVTVKTDTGCSPNRSARTAATAARCASIT